MGQKSALRGAAFQFALQQGRPRMSLPGTSRATSGGTRTTAFQPRADSRDKGRRVTAVVKGFGCRPVVTYLRALRAGVLG